MGDNLLTHADYLHKIFFIKKTSYIERKTQSRNWEIKLKKVGGIYWKFLLIKTFFIEIKYLKPSNMWCLKKVGRPLTCKSWNKVKKFILPKNHWIHLGFG